MSTQTKHKRAGLLVLTALLVALLSLPVQAAPSSVPTGQRLRNLAGNFLIGYEAMSDFRTISDTAQFQEVARTEFNFVTAENAMKWDATEPSQNNFSFGQADQLVSFAQANNQKIHGHTLVWHAQLPGWVSSAGTTSSSLTNIMYNHIDKVMNHWADGQIYAWDVVNEAFNENGTRRSSPFQNVIGNSFIELAFRRARAADPITKLIYNDYNVETVNAKSNAMYNMVADFKARGVPIDGVGLQMHLAGGIDYNSLAQNMQRFAALGVEVYITEMDVRYPTPISSSNLQAQATVYQSVLDTCLRQPACKALQTWGVTDRHSWVPGTFPGTGDALLFDYNYNPKPAYYSVQSRMTQIQQPTNTPTPRPPTNTPTLTRTPTQVATSTSTPIGPTNTPTAVVTSTPVEPTNTPIATPTPGSDTPCSPVTGTISSPFSYDGAGTFCWQASDLGAYINSWNLTSLTINGVSFTNLYAVTSSLPARINGYWYVSYSGQYPWSHFEAVGTGGPTATTAPTTVPTNTPTVSLPTDTPTVGIPTSTPTTGVPTSTPTQVPQGTTIAINAGGTDAGGFLADAYFTGGSTYNTTNTIDTTQLSGTVPPQAVLQTERYGEFTYTIPNRTPGSAQSVTLYFQESYWTAAGQRTFNVSINGATVLSAFDIFAAAGGANRAIARTFSTTANSSGQVVIAFTRGGGPDNPKVEGLSVTGAGVVPTITPTATPGTGTRPSAGCGRTRTLQNGTHTIQSGGVNRTYILNVPSTYSNTTPYRLVIGYPWGGGTANDVANGGYYGLLPRANNTTIFIAPQGIDNGWANTNGRDVTFTDAFLSQVLNDLCVDQSRVFATGFSYGGGMSFAVACARPTVFRAVTVIAGGAISGCSGGTSPVAYMGVHGISDNITTISGGRALRDRFVTNNGYPAQNAPEPAVGSRTHICTKYQGGMAAYPVEWCAFDGGHQASPFDGGSGDDGSRSWVPGETWAFFSQF